MLQNLSAAVAGFVVATISAGGYAGILALMAIESACIPLPSEIVMPFAGYLVAVGRFDLVLVATAGAVGCNLGSTVAYMAGKFGGRPLVERWGRYLLIARRDLKAGDRFFARFGGPAVLIGRLLPVVRTFVSLPAGVARMPMLSFQLYTFIGSWPWCFLLAYIGFNLGQHWNSDPRLRDIMHRSDAVVLAAVALAVGWYVWRHLRRRDG